MIESDSDAADELARPSLAAGLDPLAAIDEGFVPGICYAGEQFRCGDGLLPDMLLAGRAMPKAIGILEPESAVTVTRELVRAQHLQTRSRAIRSCQVRSKTTVPSSVATTLAVTVNASASEATTRRPSAATVGPAGQATR